MKLLSSVNCFRLWLAVVGSEIAFLSPSPLLSLSRSLFFPPSSLPPSNRCSLGNSALMEKLREKAQMGD